MVYTSISEGRRLTSISRLWKIVGMLVLVSIVGGCVGKDIKQETENLSQNFSQENNTTQAQDGAKNNSDSSPNQMSLIVKYNELNKTGKIPITLKIVNPVQNDTVITIFKPEFGSVFQDEKNITNITNSTWTRTFSVKPKGNTSYVLMYVQISNNNTVVKKGAWNITLVAPGG